MPIIDLQSLTEQTIDFKWLDGEVIHVPQPTARFVNKVDRAENSIPKAQELVFEFLQTNKDSREFTKDEIDDLNSAQLTAILMAILGFAQEVDSHPN